MPADAQAVAINTWEQLVRFEAAITYGLPSSAQFLFRGQAREEWLLVSSLARHARAAGLTAEQTLEIEQAALREFQAHAHLHLPQRLVSDPEDQVGWWIAMQHYHAPTRLLDWTGSLFIAAYFAVEQAIDVPGAIWMIHPHTILNGLPGMWPQQDHFPRALLTNPAADGHLAFVGSGPQTERMGAQQMAFSLSAQVLADYGDLCRRACTPDDIIRGRFIKLVIPAAQKREFLARLRRMNIAARALFPGLDGVGRSVNELVQTSAWHLGAGR